MYSCNVKTFSLIVRKLARNCFKISPLTSTASRCTDVISPLWSAFFLNPVPSEGWSRHRCVALLDTKAWLSLERWEFSVCYTGPCSHPPDAPLPTPLAPSDREPVQDGMSLSVVPSLRCPLTGSSHQPCFFPWRRPFWRPGPLSCGTAPLRTLLVISSWPQLSLPAAWGGADGSPASQCCPVRSLVKGAPAGFFTEQDSLPYFPHALACLFLDFLPACEYR